MGSIQTVYTLVTDGPPIVPGKQPVRSVLCMPHVSLEWVSLLNRYLHCTGGRGSARQFELKKDVRPASRCLWGFSTDWIAGCTGVRRATAAFAEGADQLLRAGSQRQPELLQADKLTINQNHSSNTFRGPILSRQVCHLLPSSQFTPDPNMCSAHSHLSPTACPPPPHSLPSPTPPRPIRLSAAPPVPPPCTRWPACPWHHTPQAGGSTWPATRLCMAGWAAGPRAWGGQWRRSMPASDYP